jgi:hypothetical protein
MALFEVRPQVLVVCHHQNWRTAADVLLGSKQMRTPHGPCKILQRSAAAFMLPFPCKPAQAQMRGDITGAAAVVESQQLLLCFCQDSICGPEQPIPNASCAGRHFEKIWTPLALRIHALVCLHYHKLICQVQKLPVQNKGMICPIHKPQDKCLLPLLWTKLQKAIQCPVYEPRRCQKVMQLHGAVPGEQQHPV